MYNKIHNITKTSWQDRKERPNKSTNNGYMVDKAKRDVESE